MFYQVTFTSVSWWVFDSFCFWMVSPVHFDYPLSELCLPGSHTYLSCLAILFSFLLHQLQQYVFIQCPHIPQLGALSQQTSYSSSSYHLPAALPSTVPVPWVQVCCGCMSWDWASYSHFFAFWLAVFLQWFSSAAKKSFCWWGVRALVICGHQDKYLKRS